MGLITKFKKRMLYKEEIEKGISELNINLSKDALKMCVDFSMMLDGISEIVTKGSNIELDKESKNYVFSFMYTNLKNMYDSFNKVTKQEDNSYIG